MRPWTTVELRRAAGWRKDGVSFNDIATRLSRTVYAVQSALRRHDLHGRRCWTHEDREELARLYLAGHSLRVVARRLSRSYWATRCQWLRLSRAGAGDASDALRDVPRAP